MKTKTSTKTPTSLCAVFLVAVAGAASAATPVCSSFARGGGPADPALVALPDGSVWYTDIAGNRLVRVGPDRQATAVIPVDAQTTRLSGLAVGPDGNLWYTKDSAGRIGKLPPRGGTGTEYATTEKPPFPRDIVAGPDGAMWFHDPVQAYVGRISTGGALSSLKGPTVQGRPFSANGLAAGRQGDLWLTSVAHNAVYRVSTAGAFNRFDIASPNAQPQAIAAAPDGSLWFTMFAARKLGRISPEGEIRELDVGPEAATHVVVGDDGTVWFTMKGWSMAGRVTPQGAVEKFRCGNNPSAITIGPDGRPWALGNGQMIVIDEPGRAVLAAVTATASVPAPAGAAVEVVSGENLDALLASTAGRVVVQFTSFDAGCGYCVRANPVFDDLAGAHAGQARFVRVHGTPWRSVLDLSAVRPLQLGGLPAIVVFEAGRETRRVVGQRALPVLVQEVLGSR